MMGVRILGIDLGIASCGWAIIEFEQNVARIVRIGVWEWDPPEIREQGRTISTKKERGLVQRRRRLLGVRRKRMRKIKELLAEHKIIARTGKDALVFSGLNPWKLRKEALDRKLEDREWAVVLGHMAKHRAYQSNSKRQNNEKDDDRKRLLKALSENQREFDAARSSGKVRTIGEWLAEKDRQRNRGGEYQHSILREWVKQEAVLLFERQRALGNPFALTSLRERYLPLAFDQGAITAPEVQDCTFEPPEKRAAKHSYSFERFRLLQRLTNIRIVSKSDPEPRRLTEGEIGKIESRLGIQATITYKTVRRLIGLSASDSFLRINGAEQEDKEIVTGAPSGKSAPGTRALRSIIIEHFGQKLWNSLLDKPDTLDGIAAAIAHRDDLKAIRSELDRLEIDPDVAETLVKESDGGDLGFFKGTGHLSIKALRKLTPHMLTGKDYYDAQLAAGYDPSKDRFARRPGIIGEGPEAVADWLRKNQLEELIPNQIVSRAVREVFKQVLALWRAKDEDGNDIGPFDAIHLEMAREVGKSAKQRGEIEREQNRRRDRNNALRKSFVDTFKKQPSDREYERWVLWNEQQGKCPYTPYDDGGIPCAAVLEGDDRVEVDHILPRSRFNIESLDNKVLCLRGSNQNKRRDTPYEWLSKGTGKLSWDKFCDQAKIIFKQNERKLDNLLITNTRKLEESLSSRALNDTRWISKFLLAGFEKLATKDRPLRVQPVNAALVGTLRRAWGLAAWKHDPKDRSKRRADDRHHAIDAAIVATIDVQLVRRLTAAYQRAEDRNEYFEARDFPPPWKDFRRELLNTLYGDGAAAAKPGEFVPDSALGTIVSRGERRRARGQMHKETISSLVTVKHKEFGTEKRVKVERKLVEVLEASDLIRVKDAHRNHKLVELLRDWIDRKKPADDKPKWKYRLPDGTEKFEPIRSISLVTNDGPEIVPRRLRHNEDDIDSAFASVERIEMVRIDVFENGDPRGKAKYVFVPVYVNQTADPVPPHRAFVLRQPYNEWPTIKAGDKFLFSLYKFSLVRIEAKSKPSLLGYFRGLDSNDGRIKLTPQFTRDDELSDRFSPTRITSIQKFTIDRLGRKFEVPREVRTWRGKACT